MMKKLSLKKFLRKFFSREYKNFEQSQLEFRKQILKILRISANIFVLSFMVIIFPFQMMHVSYYVFFPTFFVLNNILSWLINRKRFEHLCPRYLFILQMISQFVGLELASSGIANFNSDKALLMGIQVGLLQCIGFLNISSSLLKMVSSLFFFVQVLMKHFMFDVEGIYTSLAVILCVLIFVNFVCYRFEMLNFSIWNSYVKSNLSLLHFQKLIDIFPSQIAVINKKSFSEDKALYFNQEAERFLERDMGLKAFLDLFWIEDSAVDYNHDDSELGFSKQRSTLKILVQELLASAEKFEEFQKMVLEFKGLKWEIKYGWIEWSKEMALILIFSDISKNEKISELESLDKNKDRVLATVSHELRTPLNAVVGMIDVAIEEVPENSHSVKHYLKIAKEAANTLSLMINNILDIELIRKGKLHLNFQRCLLSEIVENVVALADIMAKKKNLVLIYKNRFPASTSLYVDPMRFQQILINLLDNAVKFTPQGVIKISIKYKTGKNKSQLNMERERSIKSFLNFNADLFNKNVLSNNCYTEEIKDFLDDSINELEEEVHYLKVSVTDTGIGIPEEKKKCLFKLFGKEETNLTVRGMGLGLAISQSLALKMGSTGIFLKTPSEKGSKFCFKMKANIGESTFTSIPDEKLRTYSLKEIPYKNVILDLPDSKIKLKPFFKILVVDDDDVNHLVISLYLKAFTNFIITEKAYNGKEAINLILQKAESKSYYDLILMDCDMPIMNGLEATIAIKEFEKLGKIPEVKIVALTANASLSNKEECINNGMAEVWNKPISKKDFFDKLKDFLPESFIKKINF